MSDLFTTPLNAWHHAQGAKMAPFAGWDMPIQYKGILVEHQHTRTAAGLFDICHMGEFLLHGEGAKDSLATAVTHNLDTLKVGRCRYGFLLNEAGGILDDLIVYCLAEDSYMLVVNGACVETDFAAIKSRIAPTLHFEDVSAATAKLDLQGPLSIDVMEAFLGMSLRDLPYFAFKTVTATINGVAMDIMLSRTGYTGELGYELYLPWKHAEAVWLALLNDERVMAIGLGARDTLRLEVGLPLYGQDLDTEHTPVEAGYGSMITSTADFAGKAGLANIKQCLIALSIQGRRAARHGDAVALPSGDIIGVVTSGSIAPSLGHAIALAYVDAAHAELTDYEVRTARAVIPATRCAAPFYTAGTARTKLS
ncbi:MAG: glycine cleavage system aminomethyltransferase GcvT [Pseudomonadota bacterium]